MNRPYLERRREPVLILVVDDEEALRVLAAAILEDEGYEVVEAASADAALVLLGDKTLAIDLIFSDIQMPGRLDGCDLARWVHDHRPDLPVILTSGRVQDDMLCAELSGYVPIERKPYRADALASRVREALAH